MCSAKKPSTPNKSPPPGRTSWRKALHETKLKEGSSVRRISFGVPALLGHVNLRRGCWHRFPFGKIDGLVNGIEPNLNQCHLLKSTYGAVGFVAFVLRRLTTEEELGMILGLRDGRAVGGVLTSDRIGSMAAVPISG